MTALSVLEIDRVSAWLCGEKTHKPNAMARYAPAGTLRVGIEATVEAADRLERKRPSVSALCCTVSKVIVVPYP
jgi:hypothetical protein